MRGGRQDVGNTIRHILRLGPVLGSHAEVLGEVGIHIAGHDG